MTIPVPEFCRIEYLTPNGWTVGHAGLNLMNPQRYVKMLAKRGTVGRAVVVDTDQIFYGATCSVCSSGEHTEGMCLI
jgi:hypothetical protein